MRYDYRKNMYEDIMEYIEREFGLAILLEMYKEDAYNKLYDDLWVYDGVTGNASGSYTFSSYTAGEYLVGNWDLLLEAMEEFAIFDMNPIEKGEEWCDVTIRCYLLGSVLSEVIEDLFSEYEEEEEEEEEDQEENWELIRGEEND